MLWPSHHGAEVRPMHYRLLGHAGRGMVYGEAGLRVRSHR